MAKTSLVVGTTSYLARVFIQDSSSSTGAGLTGLAYNTASLVCYRARDDDGNAGGTAITLATATRGTWTSGGFVEKDATNMPGVYEFGVPNAALASGSKTVTIVMKGATNMAPLVLEYELTATNNQDAVRGGMTALPNVNSGSAGAIITSGTGTAQLSVTSGVASANATQFGGQTVSAAGTVTMPGTVASTTNITAGTITTVTNLTNAPSDSSGVTTLLSRLTSTRAGYLDNLSAGAVALASSLSTLAGKFTGITLLAEWLGALAGKQTPNSTAQTEIRATGAGSGTYDATTDSLEALKDDQMTAAELEDAVWDATLADHQDAGSTGEALGDASSAGDPWNTALPGAYSAGTAGYIIGTNLDAPVSDVPGDTWDVVLASHQDAGSTGEALGDASSAGDPWNTALPGSYGAGTAGKIIGDNINATISSRATPAQVATELATYDGPTNAEMVARTLAAASYATAAAQTTAQNDLDLITGADGAVIASGTQTFNMTGNITGSLSGSVGSVSGAVGSVTGAVGSVTGAVGSVTGAVGSVTGNVGGNVVGSVGSLGATAQSNVRTQAGNALADYGAIP